MPPESPVPASQGEAPSADPLGTEGPPAGTEEAPDSGPAFPTTLAGGTLDVQTYSGREWLAEFGTDTPENERFAADTRALLDVVGKDLDDLTVRSALHQPSEGNQAVIVALRIAGAEARDFAADAVRLMLGDVDAPEFALRPLGRRWVLRVVDAAVPGVYPRTVYLDGDTAWIIGADEPHVIELLEQLPIQAYQQLPDAQNLATQVPLVLDGRRRTGLYEAIEPLFLDSLSERLGPEFEQWTQDLYLDSGITPTDLLGVIAWWGIESTEDSLKIEGYQVPGGPAELVERLRAEIFLAGGEALPEEVSRTEQELGGRQVTSLDLGIATKHIFASGDTVWVVTDPSGEPAMAEEAVAALP
jgi:hypothetical protein